MGRKKKAEKKQLRLRLDFIERNQFGALLPREGDVMTLVIAKGIREKVAISPAEAKAAGLKVNVTADGQMRSSWNPTKAKEKSFVFDEVEQRILSGQVKQLDKQKKIPASLLNVVKAIQAAE